MIWLHAKWRPFHVSFCPVLVLLFLHSVTLVNIFLIFFSLIAGKKITHSKLIPIDPSPEEAILRSSCWILLFWASVSRRTLNLIFFKCIRITANLWASASTLRSSLNSCLLLCCCSTCMFAIIFVVIFICSSRLLTFCGIWWTTSSHNSPGSCFETENSNLQLLSRIDRRLRKK